MSAHPRKPWSQPLADLVAPCLRPAAAQQGFDEASLLLFWPDIVGARLAERCQPIRLAWPPRGTADTAAAGATLVVRVEGAFAVELQHQAAQVLERVNAHAGWRCATKLALRQGPLVGRPRARGGVPAPDAAAVARALSETAAVTDAGLRDALVRLGSRVLTGGAGLKKP